MIRVSAVVALLSVLSLSACSTTSGSGGSKGTYKKDAKWAASASFTDSCCCDPSCPCLFGSKASLGRCEGRIRQRRPKRLVGLRLDRNHKGSEFVAGVHDQIQIRRLTTEGVERDPRFGLRRPFNDWAEVRVTEECLKDFRRKIFRRELDPGAGRLHSAPAGLPLDFSFGAREDPPDFEFIEGLAVFRDHDGPQRNR